MNEQETEVNTVNTVNAEVDLDREDYQDQVEQVEDNQEAYENMQFDNQFSGIAEVPLEKKPESLYTLFQKVWAAKDSTKVGNLDKYELGKLDVNVRSAQYLALLSNTLRHRKFGQFWTAQGEIILATSASKKGWFPELFVSQKKFTTRAASITAQQSNQKRKWSLFGTNQSTEQDS